jgi:hypothetical protein
MRFCISKRPTALPLLLCLLGSACAALAQEDPATTPAKVLVINREYTKPGKGGALHEKTESAYIAAAKAGKAPFHYLAATSMTGPDRALFFVGYPSFTAWENENKTMDAMPATGAALDKAMVPDGDLLSETDTSVWIRDDEQSYNPKLVTGTRYLELSLYRIKPGHDAEWSEVVKLVKAGYMKAVPEASWTVYGQYYGTYGSAYLVITPLKSVAELDQHLIGGKAFADALGKDGLKKLDELVASCVSEEQQNLFRISPKMSIPPLSWINAEPDFWQPKAAAPKKAAAKPAQ